MAVLISKSILMNIIFCSMIILCILVNLAHANWHIFLKLYGTSVKSFKDYFLCQWYFGIMVYQQSANE